MWGQCIECAHASMARRASMASMAVFQVWQRCNLHVTESCTPLQMCVPARKRQVVVSSHVDACLYLQDGEMGAQTQQEYDSAKAACDFEDQAALQGDRAFRAAMCESLREARTRKETVCRDHHRCREAWERSGMGMNRHVYIYSGPAGCHAYPPDLCPRRPPRLFPPALQQKRIRRARRCRACPGPVVKGGRRCW